MGTALKDSMVLSHALVEPNRAAQWLETIGLMRQTYVFLDSSMPCGGQSRKWKERGGGVRVSLNSLVFPF